MLVVGCDPHDPAFAQVLPLPWPVPGCLACSPASSAAAIPWLCTMASWMCCRLAPALRAHLDELFSANLAPRLSGLDGSRRRILIDSPLPAQASDFLAGVDQVLSACGVTGP